MRAEAAGCPDFSYFRLHGGRGPTRPRSMSSSAEAPTNGGRQQPPAGVPAIDPDTRSGAGPGGTAEKPKKKRRPAIFVVLGLMALGGFFYCLHGRSFEETDDAQIDGNISNLGPRVAGTVTAVHVQENQPVQADEVLLEIDPTDLTVAVAQARAAVALATAQLQAEDPTVSITMTSNTAAVAGASSELLSANAGLTGA